MFIHDQKDLIITVHVDDLRIFGRSEDRITQFKKEIRKEFDMTDEAEGTLYLGMHVEHSPGQVKARTTPNMTPSPFPCSLITRGLC